ncbi:MAG: stage V sporulation protein AD [Oscillospiraceae bacterium]|nr:stage V sporulation protein AD [Oscillospiraceae bacterium]
MRKGDTICFARPPVVGAFGAVGGRRESRGPLAAGFDQLYRDNRLEQSSWEEAERALQSACAGHILRKAGLPPEKIDLALAGDLQAQCTASGYAFRGLGIPFAGLYGACSTMAEALALAACLASAGLAGSILALTSSHFCAAERQFRTPLDYGGKRTPTAQWTATAAGGCLVHPAGKGVRIPRVAFGRVTDLGVTDINNMGAAMAPAAARTLSAFFKDTGAAPTDFDAIYTGDLGLVGSRLLGRLMEEEGLPLANHRDCGLLLYDRATQQVGAGGSGAGCSAAVLAAHILPGLLAGRQRRVLFIATGALMSQTTFLQGQSIPGVAHLVELAAPEED